jgi:hypothetical protein
MKTYAVLAGCLFAGFALVSGPFAQAKVASTTTASVSSPSFAYGAAVVETFTVTVTGATGDGKPTGTVTVSGNGGLGSLATITVSAACTTVNAFTRKCTGTGTIPAGTAPGTYTITAAYGGDGTYRASSGTATVGISKADPTAAFPMVTGTYGGTVTLSATNTGAGGAAPTGAPTFKVNSVTVAGATCTTSGLVRTCTVSYHLPAALTGNATYTTKVTFAANANYNSSIASGTLKVDRATATATISSPTGYYQEKVPLTMTETGLTGYAAPTGAPSIVVGTVTQRAKKHCTTAGDVDTCTTTYNDRAAQPVGTYTITVTFAENENYAAAVGTGTLTVTLDASMTTVTAVPQNINPGGMTTLTATLVNTDHEADVPAGMVTFTDGATNFGNCTLAAGTCSLVINGSSLPAGRETTVTGTYGGLATKIAGSSGTVTLTVPADIVFTSVSHDFGTVPVGDSTTYSAQLSNNDATAFAFAFTMSGPSTITARNNCGTSVAAGKTCELLFTYTPTAPVGVESATWSVASNGLIFSPANGGTVKGQGVAAAGVTITTDGHNFGAEDVGTSSDVYGVVLTNGTATAVQVAITQTDTTDFITYANNCPATLQAYQSCNLQYYFEPQSTGELRDTVALNITQGGSPVTIMTLGGATATGIALSGQGQ